MPLRRDDIVIRFGGDDRGFQKAAKRVHRTGSEVAGAFRRFGVDIASAFGIGAGLAGGSAVAVVAKMTQQLDELGKTATGLKTTVEELHALRFAVSQTSTATEQQLDTALQKLIKHVGQANRGIKESQKLFTELGLSWEYLSTLDTSQVFLEVNAAIAAQENEFVRASLAQKVYEDNWRRLMPTIAAGRDTMEGLVAQSKALGGPTTEAAEAAAQLNDAIGRMNQTMQGVALDYGPAVIEWLNGFVAVLTGTTGAVSAVDKLDESLNKLYDARQRLLGQGNVLHDFLNLFLTDAERESGLADIDRQIQALIDERVKLQKQQQALQKTARELSAPTPSPETSAGKKGKGAAGAKKPDLTYAQANAADFDAYRSGDIDRDEWLKRERTRNPYTNPESPYAGDFSQANYGSVTPAFEVVPKVSESFTAEIERAVTAAMEGRTYTMKVKPELVGMEGVELTVQDTADKEGTHP